METLIKALGIIAALGIIKLYQVQPGLLQSEAAMVALSSYNVVSTRSVPVKTSVKSGAPDLGFHAFAVWRKSISYYNLLMYVVILIYSDSKCDM